MMKRAMLLLMLSTKRLRKYLHAFYMYNIVSIPIYHDMPFTKSLYAGIVLQFPNAQMAIGLSLSL